MATTPEAQRNSTGTGVHRHSSPASAPGEQFSTFLERTQLTALDVVRGTTPFTRRFFVGEAHTGVVRYAVSVASPATHPPAVDAERRILLDMDDRLGPALARTVPRVIQPVVVGADRAGLVVSGVPGLEAARGNGNVGRGRAFLDAVEKWLAAVWHESAGAKAQVSLGGAAARSLLSNHGRTAQLEPALDAILRARRHLAEQEVATTLTHGCLCPHHVITVGDAVTGVDDWGSAGTGDPLRELGQVAVRVAANRLPEVLVGRTSFAGTIRHFVIAGLALNGVPRRLWREVLVLAKLELANDAFNRGDPDGLVLLGKAVRTLHAGR